MKLLLTGASSYVGARLFFDLEKHFVITGTYTSNNLAGRFTHLDITDPVEVRKRVFSEKPDIIIHAANNASAKWCLAHPAEARLLNVTGTEYITRAADEAGAAVFYVSSFSADDTDSVYGRSKKESEEIIKTAGSGYLILRPSLILGMSPNTVNDRPFNRILKNLETGTPAVYDTSWKFQPTYVRHLSETIQHCIDNKIRGIIIPVAVPEMKSRYDVARDILSHFGITVTPADTNDPSKVITENPAVSAALHLPKYTYAVMMENIINEIRNRSSFIL